MPRKLSEVLKGNLLQSKTAAFMLSAGYQEAQQAGKPIFVIDTQQAFSNSAKLDS